MASVASAQVATDRLQGVGGELEPTCVEAGQSANALLQNESIKQTAKALGQNSPAVSLSCETPLTPVIRDTPENWTQIAGARFPRAEVPGPESKTPSATAFDLELYTVAFRNTKEGLMGGSICKVAPDRADFGESDLAYIEAVRECERVPIIYSFTNYDEEGPLLREIWRAPDADRGGYVSQLAWVNEDLALAVGGDGRYVRREEPIGTRSEEEWVRDDERSGAGMARAWRITIEKHGSKRVALARELRNLPDPPGGYTGGSGDELPDQMRALSALKVWFGGNLYANGNHLPPGAIVWAGGLRQIWEWTPEGGFTRGFGDSLHAPSGQFENLEAFRFRVRAFGFSEDPDSFTTFWRPYALTAGCCAENAAANYPRLVNQTDAGRWSAPAESATNARARPMSYWAISSTLFNPTTIVNPDGRVPNPGDPDYPEPASVLNDKSGEPELRRLTSETYRLTSLDDDGVPRQVQTDFSLIAVGARESGQGLLQSPRNDIWINTTQPLVIGKFYKLPSYGLNAVDVIGTSGIAWAVGDHGAILRMGDDSALASDEPAPPKLGTNQEARLSETDPYEDSRPPAAAEDVGEVPDLGSAPVVQADAPSWAYESEPGLDTPPTAIVMSRDGSEGWAFAGTALYHYQGVVWERCDSNGDPQRGIQPDPECPGVNPRIVAAARVPYENDIDPTNDDRFEVVGIDPRRAADKESKVWRYSDGRWRLDDPARGMPTANPKQLPGDNGGNGPYTLAFTSPSEGWAVTGYQGYTASLNPQDRPLRQQPMIFRYDGARWLNCSPEINSTTRQQTRTSTRRDCADWNDVLPYGDIESAAAIPPKLGVVAAGTRVYFWATRSIPSQHGEADPRRWPLILYRDSDKPCTAIDRSGCWRSEAGGYDPGCQPGPNGGERHPITGGSCLAHSEDPEDQGRITGLMPTMTPGGYEVWAGRDGRLTRLDDEGELQPWREAIEGAFSDYGVHFNPKSFAFAATPTGDPALVVQGAGSNGYAPLLRFDRDEEAFEVLPGPWGAINSDSTALASDGSGGIWAWLFKSRGHLADARGFFHYTSEIRKPAFEEAAHPIHERITDIEGSASGALWAATNENVVYRRDRVGGWERAPIPGWDPGTLQTSGSPVNAIGVGPNGEGVAVGPAGRIANLTSSVVKLDPAAGTSCAKLGAAIPPCGTSRDLVSVDIAPDGSALAGGAKKVLLFRPTGGDFRAIRTPEISHNATFSAISFPTANRAYLTTDNGFIFSGERNRDNFSWTLENLNEENDLITWANQEKTRAHPLTQIAVDRHGHGYASSGNGQLYERLGDGRGSQAWREITAPFSVRSIALPEGEGRSALIGGPGGVIATGQGDRFSLSRLADPFDPLSGNVTDIVLLPGTSAGHVEAWVHATTPELPGAYGGGQESALIRYASDSADPLLESELRAQALADSAPARDGELVFAAFGKSDCGAGPGDYPCGEYLGSNERQQLVVRRIVAEIKERAGRSNGPSFTLFTGDVNDAAETGGLGTGPTENSAVPNPPIGGDFNQRRWRELVAGELVSAGIPVFGAIGGQDLNVSERCNIPTPAACQGTRPYEIGPNIAWRAAMAPMPAPWGNDPVAEVESLRFEAVPDSVTTESLDELRETRFGDGEIDQSRDRALEAIVDAVPAKDPTDAAALLNPAFGSARAGAALGAGIADEQLPRENVLEAGARTHYAFDVIDTESDEPLARIAVIDSSLRSLAASDAQQNPVEVQSAWLEQVLCVRDAASEATGCTREAEVPAIVLTNTPTYSYGPGTVSGDPNTFFTRAHTSLTGSDTALDGAALEAILMRHSASVVVSGRIGWNALYWAIAPGVHEPCPGGRYPNPYDPPSAGTRVCGQSSSLFPDLSDPAGLARQSLDLFRDRGVPVPRDVDGVAGEGPDLPAALPFVISSSAGGKLSEAQGRDSSNGFWQGYAIVRVSADGDPEKTLVEQRPVFDWVEVTAADHLIRPGERLTLKGSGREVAAMPEQARRPVMRYDEISTPAITHRYELLEADPQEPWLPKLGPGLERDSLRPEQTRLSKNPCGPYVCLDPKIGAVEDQSGVVKAGNGKYPDTFAIALLSVGDHSATWPLVFKRSPSFVVDPARGVAAIPSLPSFSGTAPQPPPPPTPTQPNAPGASAPSLPAPAPLALLSASQAPEPQPPAPPAPPPPSEQPSPLSLALAPPSIAIATPTAVIQPPTPPVNPAPPGGARREARQRQAATQKSGADADSQASDGAGDLADAPRSLQGAQMTRQDPARAQQHNFARLERTRPGASFTALNRSEPAAGAQGLIYGGGITILALALALGYTHGRPTPRRRSPDVPAPAFSRARIRNR